MVSWNICNYLSDKAKTLLELIFEHFGRLVWKYPCRFLLTGLFIVFLVGVIGLGLIGASTETVSYNLWIPTDIQLYKNYENERKKYGHFDQMIWMLVTAEHGRSIFEPELMDEAYAIYLEVYNNVTHKGSDDTLYSYGTRANHTSLCDRLYDNAPDCVDKTNSFYAAFDNNPSNWQNETYNLKVASDPATLTDFYIGGIERDSDDNVLSATVLQTVFRMYGTRNDKIYNAEFGFMAKFQNFMEDKLDYLKKCDTCNVEVAYFTNRSFDDEIARVVSSDTPIFIGAMILMCVYMMLTLGKWNFVEMRIYLGITTLFVMISSLLFSFGFGAIIGFEFNSIVFLIPYILLGFGVDDIIVITDIFDRLVAEERSVQKFDNRADQFGYSLKHSGVAVTLTTVTSCAALFMGAMTTTMPAIQAFCVYGGVAFAANYLTQFLIYAPLLVFDRKRQDANRCFCICCVKVNRNEDSHDNETDESKCCFGTLPKVNTSYIVENCLIKMLYRRWVRLLIIVLFAIVFILSCAAINEVETSSDQARLVPDDSYVLDYLDVVNNQFSDSIASEVSIVIKKQDLSIQSVRDNVIAMNDALLALDGSLGMDEWLTEFDDWLAVNKSTTMDSITNRDTFYVYLDEFTASGVNTRWRSEILYSIDKQTDDTTIQSTRFTLFILQPISPFDMWPNRNRIQDVVNDYLDGTGSYAFEFAWPFSWVARNIVTLTVDNMLSAAFALFLALCALMDVRMSLFITVVVVIIDIDLFGWMYLTNTPLDTVSYVELVIAVGLTVDYVIHVSHAIIEARPDLSLASMSQVKTNKDPNESYNLRIKEALSDMGQSVIKGAWTTFLGTLALAFSNSQAFRTFFYMFLGIIFLGVAHGLLFVPSVLGEILHYCECMLSHQKSEEDTMSDIQKPKEDIEMGQRDESPSDDESQPIKPVNNDINNDETPVPLHVGQGISGGSVNVSDSPDVVYATPAPTRDESN